jgi:hypothetical protein
MPSTGIFNSVIGVDPVSGRSKWAFFDHYGPTSYVAGGEPLSQSVYGGPNPFGLANYTYVSGGLTNSGNYRVDTLYGGTGNRTKVFLKWSFAGNQQGVNSVTSSGGSGMTAGTYALTFTNTGTGGSGAAGTITVTTSAVTAIVITSPGSGYFAAPTVSAATGGTPPTLTATVGAAEGGEVAAGTNLSAETIRIMAIGG